MKKNKLNSKLREYVKTHISPTQADQNFVSKIYESFKKILNNSCIQIGSYPRFTSIRPLHDLDILYILGSWDERNCDPTPILYNLYSRIENEYENPTEYKIDISMQTHSIAVSFNYENQEVFSVDIVPAYSYLKNEFGDDIYKVPEVLNQKHGKQRQEYYQKVINEKIKISWILSDPNGYIEEAKRLNEVNADFRKTVKFIKAWKTSLAENDSKLKLKSFHVEQVIKKYFQKNISSEIFDGIFYFFVSIPEIIDKPQIKDRANKEQYIDDYLNKLTRWEKEKIIKARDYFLIQLEKISENDSIKKLFKIDFPKRASTYEKFLFDFDIPTLLDENYAFEILGEVQERQGGFRKYILDKLGKIDINRQIRFRIKGNPPNVDMFKWKVKNDNFSQHPRGEITDHRTKNDPEHSKFKGNHYVECYAILNNTCVAIARQNVTL